MWKRKQRAIIVMIHGEKASNVRGGKAVSNDSLVRRQQVVVVMIKKSASIDS